MEQTILPEAEALYTKMVAHRRWLHAHAETGFDLTETTAYVRSCLEEMGYAVSSCGKSGLTALVGNRSGKVFLLRADMDALPIREQSGLDFACQTGNMHACGHDLHTAMLLGAAKLLKDHEAELHGQVKLMFQPAEEILQGAKDMLDHGILEDPKPDAGMMIHVATSVDIPTGILLISPPGVTAPAADYFEILVIGKGCHGSAPQEGIDSLTAAAHILIGLQEISARELGLADKAVLTIGSLQTGITSNVIPDQATMSGTIRAYEEDTREKLKKRLSEISQSIATAFRASAKITFGSSTPPLKNDPTLCSLAETSLTQLLGEKAIPISRINDQKPTAGGSEDFAYVSQLIPTVMLSLAAGHPDDGYSYPLHHPKVTFDEKALSIGAAAMAHLAMEYLNKNNP